MPRPKSTGLTAAEVIVYDLMVRGLSNQVIADSLCVTIKTIKFHNTRIFRKCGVSSRLALAVKHYKEGRPPYT